MVTDMVSILASIGGALGLCLGFSIWGGFNTGPLVHPCPAIGTQRGLSEHDAFFRFEQSWRFGKQAQEEKQ